ncbi:MAG: hypothetical protein R3188_00605 [Acidiferrobacterales bacterium]|nr:hypothetical protein [Acidiferrobacterales bacterium]
MKFPRYALLAALLYGFSTVPAAAATYTEAVSGYPDGNSNTVPADTTNNAEVIKDSAGNPIYEGSITVQGSFVVTPSSAMSADADIYAIDVKGGDALDFSITNWTGSGPNPQIWLVDASLTAPDITALQWSTDAVNTPINGASLSTDGTIYIVVAQSVDSIDWSASTGVNGGAAGIFVAPADGEVAGDYDLNITCTSTLADGSNVPCGSTTTGSTGGTGGTGGVAVNDLGDQIVNVNINPFYMGRWPRINPRSRGLLPVAILSQEGFDPTQIDLSSIGFGAEGTEDSLVRCKKIRRDLNRDGVQDMVCFFSIRKADFSPDSVSATMTGSIVGGPSFTATAPLKMVPFRSRHHHGHAWGRERRR